MHSYVFSIANDFSRNPGPRFHSQGPDSGETLRRKLKKLLEQRAGKIKIILDGTVGMGSSFLDEAFGGLISKEGLPGDVRYRFDFVSTVDPSYIVTIQDSFERAIAKVTHH